MAEKLKDPKCILSADFCHLGTQRFLDDLKTFKDIKEEILKSLVRKIEILENRDLVVPDNEEFTKLFENI